MKNCSHQDISCINPYELIRKYYCNACGEVMMCSCDEQIGRRFLSHQLTNGTVLESKKKVSVTIGFQNKICNTCRNIPEEVFPKAELYGESSKIRRYYWREIFFETMLRFAERCNCSDSDIFIAKTINNDLYKSIRKEVIEEIKELHEKSPKYIYQEESEKQFLEKYDIEIIKLEEEFVNNTGQKTLISKKEKNLSVEEYASLYLEEKGFNVIFVESIPFHVLFGTLMWLLIQDSNDPKVRIVGFGDRFAFEKEIKGKQIWTQLPDDFCTLNYSKRRSKAIKKHFDMLPQEKDDLLWTFDYWIEPSHNFRQYLWAHRQQHIDIARKIINILPVDMVYKILKYLLDDYWGRYLGWPDLIAFNLKNYFFCEVKFSKDKLRLDQRNWIHGNKKELKLPFKIIKVNRKNKQQ